MFNNMQCIKFYRVQFNFKLRFYHIATRFVEFTTAHNSTAASINVFTICAGYECVLHSLASCLTIWSPGFYTTGSTAWSRGPLLPVLI